MPKLIDEQRLIDARSLMRVIMNHEISMSVCMTQDEQCGMARMRRMVIEDIHAAPTIEPEVRHGRWIECDYKHMEHGMIETEPKAGLCCSECRTGFKKNRMTYKAFCPACGAKMGEGE